MNSPHRSQRVVLAFLIHSMGLEEAIRVAKRYGAFVCTHCHFHSGERFRLAWRKVA